MDAKSLSKVRSIRFSLSQISATASSEDPAWSSAMEDTSYPISRSARRAGRGKFSPARTFTQLPEDRLVRHGEALPHIAGRRECPLPTNADSSQESAHDSIRKPGGPRRILPRFWCRRLQACRPAPSDRLRFCFSIPRPYYRTGMRPNIHRAERAFSALLSRYRSRLSTIARRASIGPPQPSIFVTLPSSSL
jgi:hypothetical protein